MRRDDSLLRSVLSVLAATALLSGCSGGAESQDADLVDQSSADTTVLKAEASDSVNPDFQPGLETLDCPAVDGDVNRMDCTKQFEERFGMPAIHSILIPRQGTFSCKLLRITTVSNKAALVNSDGVGFYYRGFSGEGRFVRLSNMKKIGKATLANGEEAVLHQFGGLANCWLGSATGSDAAKYEFKPYMQFTAEDSGEVYRNWDKADNYIISPRIPEFDRSDELLQ